METPISPLSFDEKIELLKKKFGTFSTPELRYNALIRMGKELPPLSPEHLTPSHLVSGCQSKLYLHAQLNQGKLYFSAQADALISAGLAALLISVYSGEPPETLLTRPPDFLEHLGIYASLSPNRSFGLSQIHLGMKQEALKFLLSLQKS